MSGSDTGYLKTLNYPAIVVAALLGFVIGGLWYSPLLFEAIWMQTNGYSPEDAEWILSQLAPMGFVATFFAYAICALVTSIVVHRGNIRGVRGGAVVGLLGWAGYAATSGFAVNLFSLRSIQAWLLDAGFQLVLLVVIGVIVATWPRAGLDTGRRAR